MEVFDNAPDPVIREAAFRNQAVDMRIPGKRSAKSM